MEEHKGKNRDSVVQGFIQVEVAPKDHQRGYWSKFTRWLRKFSSSPEACEKGKKVMEYLEGAEDYGLERLKNPKYANQKTSAEIQSILEQTRATKEERLRKSERENLELEMLSAEIRKTKAEAFQIETDTKLRVLKELERQGFQVSFSFSEVENKLIVIDSKKMAVMSGEITDPILLRPIDDLKLSNALETILKSERIYYVGDLIQVHEVDLANNKNISNQMLSELKVTLESRGLALGTRIDPWPPASLVNDQ